MGEAWKSKSRWRWIVTSLVLVIAGTVLWLALPPQREARVNVRFLGYSFEPPRVSFDFASAYSNPAGRGARVARFIISNGCDFPVHCSLTVRYTNAFGSFSPRDITLEAHAFTNIAGLASPPLSAGSPLQVRIPSSIDWTNSWRLMVAYREAPSLQGFGEIRYQAALWLIRKKMLKLGRLLNPVKINVTETGPHHAGCARQQEPGLENLNGIGCEDFLDERVVIWRLDRERNDFELSFR